MSEEGDSYGVMFTPTVVINDRVISIGRLISEEELEKFHERGNAQLRGVNFYQRFLANRRALC